MSSNFRHFYIINELMSDFVHNLPSSISYFCLYDFDDIYLKLNTRQILIDSRMGFRFKYGRMKAGLFPMQERGLFTCTV
jgi:hypothetical protein